MVRVSSPGGPNLCRIALESNRIRRHGHDHGKSWPYSLPQLVTRSIRAAITGWLAIAIGTSWG